MIIKKITAPASKIFTIENVVKTDKRFSEIPHLDLSFKTLRSAEEPVFFNKEDRKGYGIYTITFNDEKNKPVLAYIGSFCGTKDVASERWEKHMGTLTCRSYKTNFKKYKSRSFKKLTLGDILKNKENYKEGLTKIIDEKKETLKNDMKEIKGSLFYNDVLAEIFKINFSSSEQKIKNLLGEGTSTSKWRMRFASDNWISLKNKTKDNLLDCFTFIYFCYGWNLRWDIQSHRSSWHRCLWRLHFCSGEEKSDETHILSGAHRKRFDYGDAIHGFNFRF